MDLEGLTGEALRLLRNQDIVLFLGAGASFGTDWERQSGEGLPLGRELAGAIASEFDVDDQGGDLRKVASVAARKSGTTAVKRFVAEEVSSRSSSPLAAHRALARIRPLLVVTTNYDDLYEKALRELNERPAKIVGPEDLVHLPRGRPRVVKLHGDADKPSSLVLTGEDYLDWEANVEGLFSDVTVEFQRGSCVFVGYSLADENLRRVIGLVRKRLKGYAPKHYALVHKVDEGTAAEFGDSVEFVEGDATAFLEGLAERREREAPGSFDLAAEEERFSEAVRSLSFEEAAASCELLQEEYLRRGAINTAAHNWGRLATAAEEDTEQRVAAVARTRAGVLYLEAGDDPSAETSLERALEHAKAANMPPQEREITPLLHRARLSGGDYYRFLRDTEGALQAQGEDVAPGLPPYELYSGRAEAKEALGDDDGALAELGAALEALPREDLHARTRIRCGIARILASRARWAAAREELDRAAEELLSGSGSAEGDADAARSRALIGLVRANVHQALGEDAEAVRLYEGCEGVFSETGDVALLISALRGSMHSRQLLGDFDLEAARARLRDLLKDSPEYRKIEDEEAQGITALAAGRLAEARSSLLRAMTAAQRVYDAGRERGFRHWYADVLLEAGDHAGAMQQYVLSGDTGKSGEVAGHLTRSAFEDRAAFDELVASMAEVAFEDAVPARGAALAALTAAADVLPAAVRASLAARLSAMHELPAGFFADRNLLSEAAELAEGMMRALTEDQALDVGRGIVKAVRRTDCFRATYRYVCSALSSFAVNHPSVATELDVPVGRLAELVGGDLINDSQGAMAALVNLARVGHEDARERALELARSGNTPWHVRWRHWLADASEQELAETLRSALPRSVDRVQQMEDGFHFGVGGISPMFFQDWDLPEGVRTEAASTLSEAAADASALIRDRAEAATMLGIKADQLGEEGRRQAIESLLPLLAGEVDVHPIARSIDNPLSAVIMNVGQPDDVKAAAAYSLLRLSGWMNGEQRKLLVREIEKLRASQVGTFGASVSGGLRYFEPEDAEEQRWLQTRLLLLMNAPHAEVRDNAARCMGLMAEDGVLEFDPEILDTVLHLASSALVSDRVGACHALSGARSNEGWSLPEVAAALGGLEEDRSFRVRTAAKPPGDADGRAQEQAS